METKNNNIKFLVIAVLASLTISVGLTYAYFAVRYTNNADINTKANVVKQVDSFTTSGEAKLELNVTNTVMKNDEGKDDYTVFQSDSDTFTVSLTAGSDTATCTYDLAISSEGDSYTKSTGLGDLLEYTIQGTDGSQSFSEINVDDAMSSTITPGASDESGTQVTTGILGHYTISDKYDEENSQSATTQTWTITSKFYNLAKNQNDQLNKTFEHHVKVVNVSCINKKDNSLSSIMKKNANPETTIDFNVPSRKSGTIGIYMTTNTDSGKPVYYYRGQVDNNLIFGGFCWKIIRTTETGGTKILYNGTPNASGGCTNNGGTIGTSRYNSTYDDNTYVGYMVGSRGDSTYANTHSNLSDSTIKTKVDNWYESNIQNKGLADYLEDTVYCNDRNMVSGERGNNNTLGSSYGILGYGTNPTGYGSLARSSYFTLNASPSLVCKNTTGFVPEDNDAFTVSSTIGNGKLKYPVGLITTDEVVYAGMNTKGNKSTAYTGDNNYLSSVDYWTMSPTYVHTYGYAMVSHVGNVDIDCDDVFEIHYTRPVVSLRPGTQIISGVGTQEEPYVVE